MIPEKDGGYAYPVGDAYPMGYAYSVGCGRTVGCAYPVGDACGYAAALTHGYTLPPLRGLMTLVNVYRGLCSPLQGFACPRLYSVAATPLRSPTSIICRG